MTLLEKYFNHTSPRKILDFWHTCEFFLPFALERQVMQVKKDDEWSLKSIALSDLDATDTDIWRFQPPADKEIAAFDVYFGVFDAVEIAKNLKAVLKSPDEAFDYDEDEREKTEGLTCMARIGFSSDGVPSFDSTSVSTVSWVLGRCAKDGHLDDLDINAFDEDVRWLKQTLREFQPQRHANAGDSGTEVFTGQDLRSILKIFVQWSKNWPGSLQTAFANGPALVIKARARKPRLESDTGRSAAATGESATPRSPRPQDDHEEDEQEGDGDPDTPADIDILNSFYARDIARVIRAVSQGSQAGLVSAYLAQPEPGKRNDLYTRAGLKTVMSALQPSRLPPAHWPTEPAHAMSLMQQFAINTMLDRLKDGGIFSVNGPPGTGKTTLLRDVFSELMTRRAKVLSRFVKPQDAFTGSVVAQFADQPQWKVSVLHEDLVGYEMVVASSNNSAVENLSRDIPKASAIGKFWRDPEGNTPFGFLQPVAHNIASRGDDGKYERLAADDAPWGLVATALGKSANRRHFRGGLSFDGVKIGQNVKPTKNFDPDLQQSIWNWRKHHRGITFDAAKSAFVAAEKSVSERTADLQAYAMLLTRHGDLSEAVFCHAEITARDAALQTQVAAQAAIDACLAELSRAEKQRDLLAERERLVRADYPQGLFGAMFRRQLKAQCDTKLAEIRPLQDAELGRIFTANEKLQGAEAQMQQAMNVVTATTAQLGRKRAECEGLRVDKERLEAKFPTVRAPRDVADLDNDQWQTDGLWHDEVLNTLRSKLFAAALTLHEAWLHAVVQTKGGFASNISAITTLLDNQPLNDPAAALPIWQSLFMIVPVISSTFASVASQFRDLGEGGIGWLFVDEAGQAIPQAAVGALWRSQRAVVVGDPMQVEPVFPVPNKLVALLAKNSGLSPSDHAAADFSPSRVSVQILADRINPTGAYVGGSSTPQWVGCPLRVHRRCADPMFTVANTIAYEGKMVFHGHDRPETRLPPKDSFDLGASAWINLGGRAVDRQVVASQIVFAQAAVRRVFDLTGSLPNIYIISPFRRIKDALLQTFCDVNNWPQGTTACPTKSDLKAWSAERIGTVHTFQGKEESIVLLVLGCDSETESAAQWAASKPNLLNVALTRAKHRFFLLGDPKLWSGKPFFVEAKEDLFARISPDDFMARINRACELRES